MMTLEVPDEFALAVYHALRTGADGFHGAVARAEAKARDADLVRDWKKRAAFLDGLADKLNITQIPNVAL